MVTWFRRSYPTLYPASNATTPSRLFWLRFSAITDRRVRCGRTTWNYSDATHTRAALYEPRAATIFNLPERYEHYNGSAQFRFAPLSLQFAGRDVNTHRKTRTPAVTVPLVSKPLPAAKPYAGRTLFLRVPAGFTCRLVSTVG